MKKLTIIYLPVKDLIHLENNPRRMVDPSALAKLEKLIKNHGFQNPLQVYKEKKKNTYSILCGNHRFDAGVSLGMKEFPCIVYEGDRNKAIARAISDNKSGEWTDWDIPMLKDQLAELDSGDLDMELTGFEAQEIKGLFDNTWTSGQSEESLGEYDPTKDGYQIRVGVVKQEDRDTVVEIIEKALEAEGYEYEIKAV